jgi:ribosomal-protein-alanine N-acetyltransferase
VSVRRARPDDLATAAAIARGAGFPAYDAAALGARVDPGLLLVAEMGGAVRGLALFARALDEAELHLLAVDPGWRGLGVGGRLLDAGLERLRRAEVREVFLEVAESNRAARALYAGRGFRPVGRRAGYYADGSAALVLRSALAVEHGDT